jgi:hypothetical protein
MLSDSLLAAGAGGLLARACALHLLLHALRPLLDSLQLWLFDSQLRQLPPEFFVRAAPRAIDATDAAFWSHAYEVVQTAAGARCAGRPSPWCSAKSCMRVGSGLDSERLCMPRFLLVGCSTGVTHCKSVHAAHGCW